MTAKKKKTKSKAKSKAAKKPAAKKAPPSGAITGVEASGETYLKPTFETGSVRLTPTSNRKPNRDVVVRAFKALFKR